MNLAALDLGELIFVAVFLGLPLLRGIMEAKKRKAAGQGTAGRRAHGAPRRPGGGAAPGDEGSGRDLWERMLRGELPEPGPVAPRDVPDAALEQWEVATQVAPAPAPPIRPVESVDPYPREPRTVPRVEDEELVAEALARENAELAQRWGEAALTPARPALDVVPDAPAEDPAPYDAFASAPRDLAWGDFAGFDLRRAVLASEILGPPVALRRPYSGASTPPGLAQ